MGKCSNDKRELVTTTTMGKQCFGTSLSSTILPAIIVNHTSSPSLAEGSVDESSASQSFHFGTFYFSLFLFFSVLFLLIFSEFLWWGNGLFFSSFSQCTSPSIRKLINTLRYLFMLESYNCSPVSSSFFFRNLSQHDFMTFIPNWKFIRWIFG